MRRVVGCMTGTSIDALDASLVEVEGHGLAMRARPVRNITKDLGDLAPQLRLLASQSPLTAGQISRMARDFAILHASAILELLGEDKAELVCVHGQTVFHQPPLSWQLIQPAPIAAAVGCPVVYDLRQADLAAGGQGAPITPIADWVLFGKQADAVRIVNLGGFANYTEWEFDPFIDDALRAEFKYDPEIGGGDICACNQLLDAIARHRLQRSFDEDGMIAYGGVPDDKAYDTLLGLLTAQAAAKRSLGTGDELEQVLGDLAGVPTSALLRSACEAIAQCIWDAGTWKHPIVATGGGTRNKGLMTALGARQRSPVLDATIYGVPPEYREAICFAVLGALCQDRVPITIPAVTGVRQAPISGAWVYP